MSTSLKVVAEAVRILQMMEAAAKSLEDKSRHLYAIGQIHRANIDDQTMAIDYFEQAIDNWPENVDAAAALIDVYWEDKNWPRAEPLLTLLLEQTDRNNGKQLHALYYRSGVCAEHLQKVDQALKAYRQAYELDSTHLPTLKNMGGLLMQREEWDRAFKIFQTLLVHHRDHLEEVEISQIFFRQGSIKLEVNEKRKALDFFRKSSMSNRAMLTLYTRSQLFMKHVVNGMMLSIIDGDSSTTWNLAPIGLNSSYRLVKSWVNVLGIIEGLSRCWKWRWPKSQVAV